MADAEVRPQHHQHGHEVRGDEEDHVVSVGQSGGVVLLVLLVSVLVLALRTYYETSTWHQQCLPNFINHESEQSISSIL